MALYATFCIRLTTVRLWRMYPCHLPSCKRTIWAPVWTLQVSKVIHPPGKWQGPNRELGVFLTPRYWWCRRRNGGIRDEECSKDRDGTQTASVFPSSIQKPLPPRSLPWLSRGRTPVELTQAIAETNHWKVDTAKGQCDIPVGGWEL